MSGLSTSANISFGWAFVAGRNRVPSPAAGKTAFRTLGIITTIVSGVRAFTGRISPSAGTSWRFVRPAVIINVSPTQAVAAHTAGRLPSFFFIEHFGCWRLYGLRNSGTLHRNERHVLRRRVPG